MRAPVDAPKREEREGGQGGVVAGLKAPRYTSGENALIAAGKIHSVVRVSAPFVGRDLRIGTQGARAVDNTADGMCRNDGVRGHALFEPPFERGLHVE